MEAITTDEVVTHALDVLIQTLADTLQPALDEVADLEERAWLAKYAAAAIVEGYVTTLKVIMGYRELKGMGMSFEDLKVFVSASQTTN